MAVFTKADLRNRVLKHIARLPEGDTASAGDAADVEQVIDDVNEILIGKGLVQWETSAIPDYAMLPMIAMVSFWVRPMFEMPANPDEWDAGELGLRRQVSRALNGEPVPAIYY